MSFPVIPDFRVPLPQVLTPLQQLQKLYLPAIESLVGGPTIFDANATPYNCVRDTGADQVANIQSVIDAAIAYAMDTDHASAVVIEFDPGVYTLSGSLTQDGTYNAQVTFPHLTSQDGPRPLLTIRSKNRCGSPLPLGQVVGGYNVKFKSTLTGLSYSGTFGLPCMFGGPDAIHGSTQSFLGIHLQGLTFEAPEDPSLCGVNGFRLDSMVVEDCIFTTSDLLIGYPTQAEPTHPTGMAVVMPQHNFNGSEYRGANWAIGWYAGFGIGELTLISNSLFAVQNVVGFNIQEAWPQSAQVRGYLVRNAYQIARVDPASGVVAPVGHVSTGLTAIYGTLSFEDYISSPTRWFSLVADIYDPDNVLGGEIKYVRVDASLGNIFGPLTVDGATSLNLVDLLRVNPLSFDVDEAVFADNIRMNGASAQAWTDGKVIYSPASGVFFGTAGDIHFTSNCMVDSTATNGWRYIATGPAVDLFLFNGQAVLRTIGSGSAGANLDWSTGTTVVLTNGVGPDLLIHLVSYWKMNEASTTTRVDSAGGNSLLEGGGSGVTQVAGKIGNAGGFDGSANFLKHSSNARLQTGDIDFTVSAWVYLGNKSAKQIIVSKDDSTSGNREFNLDYDNSSDRFEFVCFTATDSFQNVVANSLGSPSTATWYFVTGWHDVVAQTINIQINGGAVDSVFLGAALQAAGSAEFRVGARAYSGAENYLTGRIDEVGFWKRVLTSAERAALYRSGTGLTYPF